MMKLRIFFHRFFLISCLILGISSGKASSAFYLSDSIINQGIRYSLNGEYNKADLYWRHVKEESQFLIDPLFFQLLNLQLKMVDYEDYTDYKKFKQLTNELFQKIDTMENLPRKNFLKGYIYLYDSFLLRKMNKSILAFTHAFKGAKYLEQCIQRDSSFYEAYVALGAFKYWKSEHAGILKLIGFIKDERNKGIYLLEQAVNHLDNYALYFARDQLVWIYLNEGKATKAKKLSQENIHIFPQSRFFQWTYMRALEAVKEYDKSYSYALNLNRYYRNLASSSPKNYLITTLKCIQYYQNSSLHEPTDQEKLKEIIIFYNNFRKENKPVIQKNKSYDRKIMHLIDEIDTLTSNRVFLDFK